MSLIELDKISKTFTDRPEPTHVLRQVSLKIERGEMVAIMGTSGSGKTTLMNIIGLLDRPTKGSYKLNGHDVSKLKEKELAERRRQAIGFIFQSFNLLPRLSARANIELPMIYNRVPKKKRRQRSAQLLKVMGLSARGDFKPKGLSGGQMQRVAIARALANKPSLILADEPTGNLDSKTGQEMMRLLKQLHRRGNTIIVVTHDPAIAKQTQRVIKLKDGQVVKWSAKIS